MLPMIEGLHMNETDTVYSMPEIERYVEASVHEACEILGIDPQQVSVNAISNGGKDGLALFKVTGMGLQHGWAIRVHVQRRGFYSHAAIENFAVGKHYCAFADGGYMSSLYEILVDLYTKTPKGKEYLHERS